MRACLGPANPPQPPPCRSTMGHRGCPCLPCPPAPAAAKFGVPPALVYLRHPHLSLPSRPGFALRRGSSHFKQPPSPTLLYAHPAPMGQDTPSLQPALGSRPSHRGAPSSSPHPVPASSLSIQIWGKAVFHGERKATAKNSSQGNQCERAFVKIFFNGKTFFQLNYLRNFMEVCGACVVLGGLWVAGSPVLGR